MPSSRKAPSTKDQPARPAYSVTALATYEECPYQYFITHVCHIPPPVTYAMRRGASIHNLIKRHFTQPALIAGEVDPVLRDRFDRFLASRFNVPPVSSETPFQIELPGGDVRGRFDVVLPREDGGLEIVDFKSGSAPDRAQVADRLQLPLYALAMNRIAGTEPEKLSFTYFFLGDGAEVRFEGTSEGLAATAGRAESLMRRIQAGEFPRPPGCTCFACKRLGPDKRFGRRSARSGREGG